MGEQKRPQTIPTPAFASRCLASVTSGNHLKFRLTPAQAIAAIIPYLQQTFSKHLSIFDRLAAISPPLTQPCRESSAPRTPCAADGCHCGMRIVNHRLSVTSQNQVFPAECDGGLTVQHIRHHIWVISAAPEVLPTKAASPLCQASNRGTLGAVTDGSRKPSAARSIEASGGSQLPSEVCWSRDALHP